MYLALFAATVIGAHAGDLAATKDSGTNTGGTGVIVWNPRTPPPAKSCLAPGDDSPDPDLTEPTKDSQYDLYTRNIEALDDLLGGHPVPELGPGMAGIVDLPLGGPEHGVVFVKEDDLDDTHFYEHWFVNEPLGSWSGDASFGLVRDDALTFPPTTWVIEDGVYMYMDVHYYDTPDAAFFGSLTLNYQASPLLDAWAFDLYQGEKLVGRLLREKHANDNWVDYWLFADDYDKPLDDGENVEVRLWAAQPANASAFFTSVGPLQANFAHFALVKYKERNGCAYDEFFN